LEETRAREKRGHGVPGRSLDAPATEDGPPLEIADARATLPDAWFDRERVLAVMDRALTAAKAELRFLIEALAQG
jgi:hypothetical protein